MKKPNQSFMARHTKNDLFGHIDKYFGSLKVALSDIRKPVLTFLHGRGRCCFTASGTGTLQEIECQLNDKKLDKIWCLNRMMTLTTI